VVHAGKVSRPVCVLCCFLLGGRWHR
jgi:hypothetical protein